jgi:hypothetical protein
MWVSIAVFSPAKQSFRTSGITHPRTYIHVPGDSNPQTPKKIPKCLPEVNILSKQPIMYSVFTN